MLAKETKSNTSATTNTAGTTPPAVPENYTDGNKMNNETSYEGGNQEQKSNLGDWIHAPVRRRQTRKEGPEKEKDN